MRHSDAPFKNAVLPADLGRHELREAVMRFGYTRGLLQNLWTTTFKEGLDSTEAREMQPKIQTRGLNSMEYLISRVPPKEVALWFDSMKEVAALIEGTKPDIIFCPMRGSSPFIVALRKMMPVGFSHIPMVPLAVGSISYLKEEVSDSNLTTTKKLVSFGLNHTQKTEVIKHHLRILRDVEFDNPLVIDEVQSGSTSIQATLDVQAELSKMQQRLLPITLIGIEDNRDIRKPKKPEYTLAIDGGYEALRLHRVAAPLFHVDVIQFIDPILFTAPKNQTEKAPESFIANSDFASNLSFVPNQNGRRVLEAFATAYCDIQAAKEVLRLISTCNFDELAILKQVKPRMKPFIELLDDHIRGEFKPKNVQLHSIANVCKWVRNFIDTVDDRSLS